MCFECTNSHILSRSMLGSPVNSIEAILTHYGSESITCEWKYDGVRCQIHYDDGIIKVFNRHSEENTDTWRGDVIPYLLEKLEGREEVRVCEE